MIPAILPRGRGHQFLLYGDSCSGVPGALHEKTFASVNAVARQLDPQPDFILFPGDEIAGLTADAAELRAQWRYWLDKEMAWLDRGKTPLWNTTGNHTTYDEMSEGVFRDVLNLPGNGPPGQEGLSYHVRRGELLMVFVHTGWTGLGGEGHVDTAWLANVLEDQNDADQKLVIGHHPVFPVNGFSGRYQREVGPEYGRALWDLLVEAEVFAYLCSHILAFDVQVRSGVLQICTAGAGAAHRMPEGVEYLHCVQAALDREGLRLQVLDTLGNVRERLEWPPSGHLCEARRLPVGESEPLFSGSMGTGGFLEFRLRGRTASPAVAGGQTLFCAYSPGSLGPLWLGLRGTRQTLTLILGSEPGRSPHYWLGPDLPSGREFDLCVSFHPDMGPGGVLFRQDEDARWTSFDAASATGVERLVWPQKWSVGHGQGGADDRPFGGNDLRVSLRAPAGVLRV